MSDSVIEGESIEVVEAGEVLPSPVVAETRAPMAVALRAREAKSTNLALFGTEDPVELIQKATVIATALDKMIRDRGLVKDIKGNEHVLIEGWKALAMMVGVVVVVVETRLFNNGYEAIAEVRRPDPAYGQGYTVLSRAESHCSKAEHRWGKADEFAVQGVAQTRAQGRALRDVLGFIITLAGFQAAPAEEMTQIESEGVTDASGETRLPDGVKDGAGNRRPWWKSWKDVFIALDRAAGFDLAEEGAKGESQQLGEQALEATHDVKTTRGLKDNNERETFRSRLHDVLWLLLDRADESVPFAPGEPPPMPMVWASWNEVFPAMNLPIPGEAVGSDLPSESDGVQASEGESSDGPETGGGSAEGVPTAADRAEGRQAELEAKKVADLTDAEAAELADLLRGEALEAGVDETAAALDADAEAEVANEAMDAADEEAAAEANPEDPYAGGADPADVADIPFGDADVGPPPEES